MSVVKINAIHVPAGRAADLLEFEVVDLQATGAGSR